MKKKFLLIITILLFINSILLPVFQISAQKLVNPNAIKEAIALKTFLDTIYGKKIISGQAYESVDEKWNEYILTNTGKLPAILSLDFMNTMPWRVSQGAKPDTTTNLAIHWAKHKKGIVEMHWHWDAPKNTKFTTWQGFYSKNTSFDLAKAMNDTTLEDFKFLIRDMDLVAARLKRMQDSGVAILWRPLHEAEGAWFWWGAKGGDACKKLWNVMYDRYTNYHKLNNLIWVWNSYGGEQKGNWYPGDNTVDIIAWDYESSTSWSNYKKLFGTNGKLFALGEEGKLPDPANFSKKPWLYFITWAYMIRDQNFNNGKNPKDWLKKVYNDPLVLTLDDLIPGPKVKPGEPQTVFDSDMNGEETIHLDGSASYTTTGTIASYIWKENNIEIASGSQASIILPVGVHQISLTITTSENQTKTANVTITVVAPSLSYNKLVTVSSTEKDYGNIATNAVDGNTSTRWSSEYSDPQWIQVDLGKRSEITKMVLNWEVASAKDYRIEMSNDGISWVTVMTKSNMKSGARIDNISGLTGGARFVRIYGIKRTTVYGYSLYELEIYGTENPNAEPVAEISTGLDLKKKSNIEIIPGSIDRNNVLKIRTHDYLDANYSIYNLSGKILKSGQIFGSEQSVFIDNSFTSGLYIVKIETKSNNITKKLIVR